MQFVGLLEIEIDNVTGHFLETITIMIESLRLCVGGSTWTYETSTLLEAGLDTSKYIWDT